MNILRRQSIWVAVLFCSAFIGTASAQPANKPYEQWTQKEAEDLLIESPWAQTLGGGVSVGGTDTPSAIAGNQVTLRLRSSLPIRQALARLRQIKSKYDKLGAGDKAAVDAKNKPLIECAPCQDYYIVSLSPGPGSSKGVPSVFQRMSLADAERNVVIKNDKGETRPMVNFVNPKVAGEEAIFFFDRFDANGQPLIAPGTRKLMIWFDPKIFEGGMMRIVTVEFDVAKLTVNGEVLF